MKHTKIGFHNEYSTSADNLKKVSLAVLNWLMPKNYTMKHKFSSQSPSNSMNDKKMAHNVDGHEASRDHEVQVAHCATF